MEVVASADALPPGGADGYYSWCHGRNQALIQKHNACKDDTNDELLAASLSPRTPQSAAERNDQQAGAAGGGGSRPLAAVAATAAISCPAELVVVDAKVASNSKPENGISVISRCSPTGESAKHQPQHTGATAPAASRATSVRDSIPDTGSDHEATSRVQAPNSSQKKAAMADAPATAGCDKGCEVGNSTPTSNLVETEDVHSQREWQLRHFLSPLTKEQLIDLVANAALAYPDVYARCDDYVRLSPASRRLMVRNVHYRTTDAQFSSFFRTYGELDDALIVREADGKSKGFGFVTFSSSDAVHRCMHSTPLVLRSRELYVRLAANPVDGRERSKLFVRNLSEATSTEMLREVFAQFGTLEDCVVVRDREGRSKGFGFVKYVSPVAAFKAAQQPERVIDGRIVFIHFAIESKARRANPASSGVASDNGTGTSCFSIGSKRNKQAPDAQGGRGSDFSQGPEGAATEVGGGACGQGVPRGGSSGARGGGSGGYHRHNHSQIHPHLQSRISRPPVNDHHHQHMFFRDRTYPDVMTFPSFSPFSAPIYPSPAAHEMLGNFQMPLPYAMSAYYTVSQQQHRCPQPSTRC